MTGSRSTSPEPIGGRPPSPRLIPAGRAVAGTVTPPPSKSFTHRYLNLAWLSGEPLTLRRPLLSEDTRLFLRALEACGHEIREEGDQVHVAPAREGIEGGEVFCGNAGTMFRFLAATLTALPGRFVLDGTPRLRERPVGPLLEALRPLGAEITCREREGYA
ncbi:MAG: hypothetical protein KDD47_24425, partial [Acidobacteria bacterium]|nr:hypothetical protein [Acidobacteriota bacterium]